MKAQAGDIIVIPAGVGHKCITHSSDFTVLGAYPFHLSPDLMIGEKRERPGADERIAKIRLPDTDPLVGARGLPKSGKNDKINCNIH